MTIAALTTLTWPALACVVVIAGLHYVAAAVCACAAAGVDMPLRELVAAQLAASAANRLTPAGLGGAALLGRYFVRRGRLNTSQAAAAVSALTVFGSVADVAAFAALIGVGTLAGLAGVTGELPLLLHRLVGLVPVPTGTTGWLVVMAVAVVVAGVGVHLARSGRGAWSTPITAARKAIRAFVASLAELARRPRRLAVLMSASAATTLMLAVGFAAAATVGGGALPVSDAVALMVGYMVASAAGSALPTPGGIGTTDAALVGVLLAAHLATAPAVATVLVFRIVTFWAPAVVGAALVRPLRRNGAL